MFTVIIIMFSGMIVGYMSRRRSFLNRFIDKLIMIFIYLLLFFLGISVGSNEKIMSNLATLGIKALLLSLSGVLGSIVLSYFIYKVFRRYEK